MAISTWNTAAMASAAEPPVVQPAASGRATAVNIVPIATRLHRWRCAVSLPVSESHREGDATLDSEGTLSFEQPTHFQLAVAVGQLCRAEYAWISRAECRRAARTQDNPYRYCVSNVARLMHWMQSNASRGRGAHRAHDLHHPGRRRHQHDDERSAANVRALPGTH